MAHLQFFVNQQFLMGPDKAAAMPLCASEALREFTDILLHRRLKEEGWILVFQIHGSQKKMLCAAEMSEGH